MENKHVKRKSYLNITGTVMTTITVPFEKVDFDEVVDELIDICNNQKPDRPIKIGKNTYEEATQFFYPIFEAHIANAEPSIPAYEKIKSTDLDEIEEIPYNPLPLKTGGK